VFKDLYNTATEPKNEMTLFKSAENAHKNEAGLQPPECSRFCETSSGQNFSRICQIRVHTQISAFGFCFCSDVTKFYLHNL